MTQFQLSLIVIALISVLCFYIYTKDRVEKEPIGLLILFFVIGALMFFPVYYIQKFITGLFDMAFESQMEFTVLGLKTFKSAGAMIAHSALCAFIGSALIEGIIKWTILYFVIKKNKHFNCLFDGVVYSTFISLGFAFAEGLRYAIVDGIDMFLSRFITSLSVHLFFGILIGYFFTAFKTRNAVCRIEKNMFDEGKIKTRKFKKSIGILTVGMVFSVFAHGLFVVTTYIDSTVTEIISYALSIVLYISGFLAVRYLSSIDGSIENRARGVVEKWHKEEM